jgi:hypothetical protein
MGKHTRKASKAERIEHRRQEALEEFLPFSFHSARLLGIKKEIGSN